jgi:hypothetical protein
MPGLLLLCLPLLAGASRTAAQEANPAAAQDGAQRPRFETLAYKFDHEKELSDFERLAGSWTISAGSLWCTSKGPREELRWRRSITARGRATVQLIGAGRIALSLKCGEQETLVRLDRSAGRVEIEADGQPLAERPFESKPLGLLELRLGWELGRLSIAVGDDEAFTITRSGARAPFDGFSLVSQKSQPRIEALVLEREPVADPALTAAGALTEAQKVAIERATQLLAADDAGAALAQLEGALGETPPPAAEWPAAFLLALQRVGLRRPALLAREPFEPLVASRALPAADRSSTLTLPLRPGWSGAAAPIRRADGPVFTATLVDPPLAVEVYRYDQKLKYWFGRDPRLVYSSGGGGATLGRARADEQQDLHANSTRVREFDRSARELDGEKAWQYELSWPTPDDPQKTAGLREIFFLHRGDTWRITVAGSPLALQLAADDVDWLLARFRLAR